MPHCEAVPYFLQGCAPPGGIAPKSNKRAGRWGTATTSHQAAKPIDLVLVAGWAALCSQRGLKTVVMLIVYRASKQFFTVICNRFFSSLLKNLAALGTVAPRGLLLSACFLVPVLLVSQTPSATPAAT